MSACKVVKCFQAAVEVRSHGFGKLTYAPAAASRADMP